MLDLNFVRGNLALVEEKLRARGADPAALLGNFRSLDQRRREAITRSEQLRAQKNGLSKQVDALKKGGQDAAALIEQTRSLKQELEDLDKKAADLDEKLQRSLTGIPNLTRDEVPTGSSAADNKSMEPWWPKDYREPEFTPKPHWEVGRWLGILDLDRAAKLSGARFAVYMGAGARLERALANFMLDHHTQQHGYTEVLPPFMVNRDSMFGTGQLPKFEEDLFKVPTDSFEEDRFHTPEIGEHVFALGKNGVFRVKRVDDYQVEIELIGAEDYTEVVPKGVLSYRKSFFLIPTAEVPVTNLYRDEILDDARLPICLTAYTPCFRAEAGAAGKDTRGIMRQHQFQKVELVKFTRPEDSDREHERLTRDAEEILEVLGLPYRRVLLCTGDTGFSSAKTYDLEVWLPRTNGYREISSCSNFEAFQARRANIRYRPVATQGGKARPEFVHTINGSGLAVGRTWLAILENYQQADGSVIVPEVLRPYMGGLERIVRREG